MSRVVARTLSLPCSGGSECGAFSAHSFLASHVAVSRHTRACVEMCVHMCLCVCACAPFFRNIDLPAWLLFCMVRAKQAAVEEGIVPGGGTALLHAAKELRAVKEKLSNFDQQIGVQIIANALKVRSSLRACCCTVQSLDLPCTSKHRHAHLRKYVATATMIIHPLHVATATPMHTSHHRCP